MKTPAASAGAVSSGARPSPGGRPVSKLQPPRIRIQPTSTSPTIQNANQTNRNAAPPKRP